jgi:hypothetical protein
MNHRKFTSAGLLVIIITAVSLALTGCNIFGWTSGGDSLDSHLAKGKKHMRDGEYADAEQEFAKAIEEDPHSSDARYYHAKATILAADLNIGTILDWLDAWEDGDSLPVYFGGLSGDDLAEKNTIYRANQSAYVDLKEIYDGNAVGSFTPLDIEVDLAVTTSILAIIGLRDTDRDGDIDEDDLYLNIVRKTGGEFVIEGGITQFFDYNPGGGEVLCAPNQLTGAIYFNALLTWADSMITQSSDVITNLLLRLNPELDIETIRELLNTLQDLIRKYYVNTGIEGNPGIGDNDHDGTEDEEVWGDFDNGNRDDDEYLWEDSQVIQTMSSRRQEGRE